MSAGANPGFGLIPNAGPDDIRRLLQLMPLDPSQRPPIIDAGTQAAPAMPTGLQGQTPHVPSPAVGLLDMNDLTGPAGAQIHHPGTAKPGAPQPAIAMDEADTQRMERETGMMPAGLGSGGLLSEMFSKAPMGAPQTFSGTSGTIVPGQGADLSGSPMPPARPSAADLAAPTPAPAPSIPSFGSLARPTARPVQADMPAPSVVPTSGKLPDPAAPTSPVPTAPAAPPAGDGQDGGFLSRLGDPRVYNALIGLGQGLSTTPGLGAGIAAGAAHASKLNASQAATSLANAEFQLKQRKLQQEDLGKNLTYQSLIRKGVSAEDAQAAIAASMAGHGEALSNLLNNNFRKVPDAPAGFTMGPDGNMRAITGGPADPATKRADAQASAEGTAAGRPAEGFSLSKGQRRYDGDGKLIAEAPGEESDGFTRETKLRTEFGKGLGTFQDVHDGYGRVIAATRQREANPNGKSPASDISLIFGYMKMLDPGSVVREGEYATAGNAGGLDDRLRNTYNRILNGESLTPAQRQDFIGQAGELYGTARRNAEAVAGRYRNLAGQYGVDPERTIFLPDVPRAPTVGPNRMQPGRGSGEGMPGIPTRSDLEAEARRRGLVK